MGTHLAAINPASPPEDPPHDLWLLCGFIASPKSKLLVWMLNPVYGQLPLIIGIPPAFKYNWTITASYSLTSLHKKAHPSVDNLPFWSIKSFTEKGIPCKNPSLSISSCPLSLAYFNYSSFSFANYKA
jgi:hypothetical protein